MANTLISTTGMTAYLNNDAATTPKIKTNATYVYLNSNCSNMFFNCHNLIISPSIFNYKYVINMSHTYYSCFNITGSPACGNNVINMSTVYTDCRNLTGQPVCGANVTNMANTYYNCHNITGNPVCGSNVKYMSGAYRNCNKLDNAFKGCAVSNIVILNAGSFSNSSLYDAFDTLYGVRVYVGNAAGKFYFINAFGCNMTTLSSTSETVYIAGKSLPYTTSFWNQIENKYLYIY